MAFFLAALVLLISACAGQASASDLDARVAAGERIFRVQCSTCHSTAPDAVVVGPSLAGIAERAETRKAGMDAAEYIRESIAEPAAYIVEGFKDLMPSNFPSVLDDEQIEALVAYLLTLE